MPILRLVLTMRTTKVSYESKLDRWGSYKRTLGFDSHASNSSKNFISK
jgi:hypothetical protein